MSEPFTGRKRPAGNKGDDGFRHRRNEFTGPLLGGTTDLTDHHNRFGGRIVFKQRQRVPELCAYYRISPNTNGCSLTKSGCTQIADDLIGKCGAAADYTYTSLKK